MNEKELNLLENIINIAVGECPVEDIQKIVALERKIESFVSLCKRQKEVIDKAREFLYKIKFDKTDKYICISEYIEYQKLLDILKEVSE